MEDTTKKVIVISVSGLFVVAVVVGILTQWPKKQAGEGMAPTAPQTGPVLQTRTAPLPNVAVPDQDSQNVPANVAKPESVVPAAPKSPSSIRTFALTINNNTFTPDTVNVKQFDVASFEITAKDKGYDFFQPDYNIKAVIKQGEKRTFGFQATAVGSFKFFCQSCGGPSKGPVGTLNVVPK